MPGTFATSSIFLVYKIPDPNPPTRKLEGGKNWLWTKLLHRAVSRQHCLTRDISELNVTTTCGNMNLLGDKFSSVAIGVKAKTMDLWSLIQRSVVEFKDGGGADVALLLLMWPPPICWALPYGTYCQPRRSGPSWLMLVDTPNFFQMDSNYNNKKCLPHTFRSPWTQIINMIKAITCWCKFWSTDVRNECLS